MSERFHFITSRTKTDDRLNQLFRRHTSQRSTFDLRLIFRKVTCLRRVSSVLLQGILKIFSFPPSVGVLKHTTRHKCTHTHQKHTHTHTYVLKHIRRSMFKHTRRHAFKHARSYRCASKNRRHICVQTYQKTHICA